MLIVDGHEKCKKIVYFCNLIDRWSVSLKAGSVNTFSVTKILDLVHNYQMMVSPKYRFNIQAPEIRIFVMDKLSTILP